MTREEIFFEIYKDIPFPLIEADLHALDRIVRKTAGGFDLHHCAIRLEAPPEKHSLLVASMCGLLSRIAVSADLCERFSQAQPLRQSGSGPALMRLAHAPVNRTINAVSGRLLWEENSPWPIVYGRVLQQFVAVIYLHKALVEQQIAKTSALLTANGLSPANADLISEYPRQLPTRLHYAAASLGAWLGGAMNVQYFSYYATIRQIHHAKLNIKYTERIGFDAASTEALISSGFIAIPVTLAGPLFEAQGSRVFGSMPLNEMNLSNPPTGGIFESAVKSDLSMPGLLLDKYYRAPLWAREPSSFGFYGTADVLRDHYTQFYRTLSSVRALRCKHYCVPIVEVTSIEELRKIAARIPTLHTEGVFYRGQRKLYPLQRAPSVKQMLFADSCSDEPSLVTAASREANYIYEDTHSDLKHWIEQELYHYTGKVKKQLLQSWNVRSLSPLCDLDGAIMALAQHYGVPSHGLDVTQDVAVAVWFATNAYNNDKTTARASYHTLSPEEWPPDSKDWPVVLACQCITQSVGQSLHDCHTLAEFGFEALRPARQKARFFQGGHSDHQNRLAETVACVFRLAPAVYDPGLRFDFLFPPPSEDPAYRLMLRIATTRRPPWGPYINRFHSDSADP